MVTKVGMCIEPYKPINVAQIANRRGGKNVPIMPATRPNAQDNNESTMKNVKANDPCSQIGGIQGLAKRPATPHTERINPNSPKRLAEKRIFACCWAGET